MFKCLRETLKLVTPPPLVFIPPAPGACVTTQWPFHLHAVLVPAQVVIDPAGERVIGPLAKDAGDEHADVRGAP